MNLTRTRAVVPPPLSRAKARRGPSRKKPLSSSHFRLSAPLNSLRSRLLQPLSFVCTVLEEARGDGVSLDVLGRFEDTIWLADVAWNIGTLLVLVEKCAVEPEVAQSEQQQQPLGTSRLLLAAEFFEKAETLYSVCQNVGPGQEMTHVLGKNRYMSLLVAACARLDADSLDVTGHAARRETQLMSLEASYNAGGKVATRPHQQVMMPPLPRPVSSKRMRTSVQLTA